MSRTFRKHRFTDEKVRDGDNKLWKCRCDRCINPKWQNRNGLSVKDNLNLE